MHDKTVKDVISKHFYESLYCPSPTIAGSPRHPRLETEPTLDATQRINKFK